MNNITNLKALSSLVKIYDSDKIPDVTFNRFSMLKNEKKSFQVAIEADRECDTVFTVNSDLSNIRTYTVEHIKSDLPMEGKSDMYFRFSDSGYYPDLLLPVADTIHLKRGLTVLWIELDAVENAAGNHKIDVCFSEKSVSVEAEIINTELDFKNFVYTNWFHTDCLMTYYGFEAFSGEYWRVTENFLRTAAEYGMNCVLTPIFTPPLDTEVGKERPTVQLVDVTITKGEYIFNFDKLTQWIDMAKRCGVQYFEFSHLYTQWGAGHAPKIMATVDGTYKQIFGWKTNAHKKEYRKFLKIFADSIKNYLEINNLKDKVLIHVSDEPNLTTLRSYRKASNYIHKLFKGYKIVDALSDFWFYKLKIVSNPIPANDHIDKFLGNVENLWTYYCSAQKNNCVANRFFCNDSIRTRVIGYQMFKFDIKGFLHWGYNFYYTQLSKKAIDPFEVSDAGGKFPSGDSYIVYPAKDGTAYHSLRLKVFYDALQDMAALNVAASLTDKKTVLDIIEENGRHNLTFREYPHSDEWLLNTREKINALIKSKAR